MLNSSMRTSLVLEDELYRRIKALAVERGCTVTAVVDEALRLALVDSMTPPVPVFLPIASEISWVRQGIDLDDARSLRDALDSEATLDALR